jgi:hypothetical protein
VATVLFCGYWARTGTRETKTRTALRGYGWVRMAGLVRDMVHCILRIAKGEWRLGTRTGSSWEGRADWIKWQNGWLPLLGLRPLYYVRV